MSNPRLSSALKRKSVPRQALEKIGAFLAGVSKFLRRDPISTGLLLGAFALIYTFFTLLGTLDADKVGAPTSLTSVAALAEDKKVETATLLDGDHRVQITTTDGRKLYSDYPSSDSGTQELIKTLGAGGAEVVVDPQSGKPLRSTVIQFLLPILILVFLFAYFTRLSQSSESGGIASFSNFAGRGKKKKKGQKAPITFDSVAGAGEALTELKEIRDFLADPDKYLKFGAAAPKGVLLVGPPGTGKTLLAKATAGEADAAFFTASGAEFVESLVGVGAARVRDLFAKARKSAPAIIFIDEIDAAGRKRGAGVGQGNDEREQTLNQMLVEMDGFGGDAGIIVMGATNRPDILDPALLRPGRFDRQVVIDVPDVHGRLEILNLHARGRKFADDVDLPEIARMCPGFSGAELANLVNEAALLTVRELRDTIDQATLEEAIDRVVAGPAKKHILTDEEKWLIATHEAGHAVVTRALGQVTSVQKLSIVARGRQLGTAAHMLSDRDSVIQSRTDLERQLATILAGITAEIIAFGQESTGASDDLHAATNLAKQMVTSYGMSRRLGHVTIGEPAGEVFLGAALQDMGSTGPKALDVIDDETERFVQEAEQRAEWVLRTHWSVVDSTARALIEQETLSGLGLEALLSPVHTIDLASIPLPDTAGDDRDSPLV
ncbi:MAG: ATP-dependent zinc metalloprotease FtsH [Solirubrobacteraceae bacterium]|nr:ATP-dependent zinc metalloprotease FtsH [Solirubrobacteraceae bacterium]